MTPIKLLLNNVLDIKSDKHNLNQGNEFVKNKMKYLFKPKLIEGMGCTINDRNDPKYARFLIPSNDSHVLALQGLDQSASWQLTSRVHIVRVFCGPQAVPRTVVLRQVKILFSYKRL